MLVHQCFYQKVTFLTFCNKSGIPFRDFYLVKFASIQDYPCEKSTNWAQAKSPLLIKTCLYLDQMYSKTSLSGESRDSTPSLSTSPNPR